MKTSFVQTRARLQEELEKSIGQLLICKGCMQYVIKYSIFAESDRCHSIQEVEAELQNRGHPQLPVDTELTFFKKVQVFIRKNKTLN